MTRQSEIQQRIESLHRLADPDFPLDTAVTWISSSLQSGGKILSFGNGGSATQASHFSSELVNRFQRAREGYAALALTVDGSSITSIANDSDFECVFSRQIDALARKPDVVLGLTTSGTSPNVLRAVSSAAARGLRSIVLCGENTTRLQESGAGLLLPVASRHTPVIQEMHLFLLHLIAGEVENRLSGAGKE